MGIQKTDISNLKKDLESIGISSTKITISVGLDGSLLLSIKGKYDPNKSVDDMIRMTPAQEHAYDVKEEK